jgi:hypothetical protein
MFLTFRWRISQDWIGILFFCFHTIAGLQDVRIEAFQEQYSPGQEMLVAIANLGRPLCKTEVWSEARTSWQKWCCTVLYLVIVKECLGVALLPRYVYLFVDPFISSDAYHLPCMKSRLPSRGDLHHRKLLQRWCMRSLRCRHLWFFCWNLQ